jgi:hypothetical protein
MKSVHRNVTGYGSTPTASTKGIFMPKIVNDMSMKRLTPRMLSIVIEPRKSPAMMRNTNSRLACSRSMVA